ncbi:MAG: hypothetical protein HOG57_05310, partial [Nitrosopumilus sp.]|nr:hypothetical protein [Nitrosopumilus sp.]
MTKNVQKISLLAIIPIIAVAMTFVPITDVNAQKICGDRLCISGDVEDERKKMRDSFSVSPTEPTKIIDVAESEKQIEPGSILKLSRASVATDIPLHLGYYNGDSVYFIITDASDQKHAKVISEK